MNEAKHYTYKIEYLVKGNPVIQGTKVSAYSDRNTEGVKQKFIDSRRGKGEKVKVISIQLV